VGLIAPELRAGRPDFVCLNFANPDMVGHTGVFDAVVKAVETTDACLKEVVEAGREQGYAFVVIADHGNADLARNADGSPHTAHTTNPVPVFVLADGVKAVRDGILADVAPTVLDLMGVAQPAEMTGQSIIARG
jgi:2,3-bisphosphoglycerate-independent phosphoglycerate mutase